MGEEDAEKYLETDKEQEIEIAVFDSYGPLWTVTESWYDGSTLYFWAEASEAIVKDDSLEAYGKGHARVNGQECLLNASEEYDEESQTYTGRFFCSIDLSNREVETPMEVEIRVELTKNHNEVRIPYMIPPEADTEEYCIEKPEKAWKLPKGSAIIKITEIRFLQILCGAYSANQRKKQSNGETYGRYAI